MSITAWHSPSITADRFAKRWSPAALSQGRVPTRPRGGDTPRTGRLSAPDSALTSMVRSAQIECAGGHTRSTGRRLIEGELR
jgi:hypothetical protein